MKQSKKSVETRLGRLFMGLNTGRWVLQVQGIFEVGVV